MADSELVQLTLENVADGALPPLFNAALQKVMADIRDPHSDGDAARTITISLKFVPLGTRSEAFVWATVKPGLAKSQKKQGLVFMREQDGQLVAEAPAVQEELELVASIDSRRKRDG